MLASFLGCSVIMASSASSLSDLGSCSLEVTSSAILLFSFGAKMFSHDPFRIEFHDAYMKKLTAIIISVDQKLGRRTMENVKFRYWPGGTGKCVRQKGRPSLCCPNL